MASTADLVRIEYLRLPARRDAYIQRVLERTPSCIVTFNERTPLCEPMVIGDRRVLEPDSPVIWFTFPGAWHDIGLFHLTDGTFTGTYANAITPVRFVDARTWQTTDLFLDLWLDAGGSVFVLDEDELEHALRLRVIEPALARRARAEITRVRTDAAHGDWPPPIVGEWSLERARAIA
ncbi:MAG: DUF402 domain-containing protein [Gemmatimonadetes bacterium]|nr:DUF402 domain-containing protein [Gemmatimonadota bacterium]